MVPYVRSLAAVTALLALLVSCSAPSVIRSNSFAELTPRDIRGLALAVDSVLTEPAFLGGLWSAHIRDLETGRTLFSRNDQVNLLPASNAKMFTTAAALEQLGPQYRYVTMVIAHGQVRDDTLHGDLIVRGSGDPTLNRRFFENNPLRPLEDWADSVLAAGITVIDGDLIGDDNLFDDEVLGYGWQWDDEPYYYSAQVSALSLNGNCVDFTVSATRPGQPADVAWQPHDTGYITVTNGSVTLPAGEKGEERYYRARASNHIDVLSTVPAASEQAECLTIENPTRFFVHVLREILGRRGITVTGAAVDIDDLVEPPSHTSGDAVVARHMSTTLDSIVAAVNKPSDNLMAELLLRTIGSETPVSDTAAVRGSARRGAEAAARTFAAAGIDTSRIRLVDGSGLSRMHLVSTDMTVKLLSYMWNHAEPAVREAFIASLPIGGIDGTLQGRYPSGPAHANVVAKTGTMTSVSNLGGYVRTASGRPIAFALMCNNYTSPTSTVRTAQDRIVDLLARLP